MYKVPSNSVIISVSVDLEWFRKDVCSKQIKMKEYVKIPHTAIFNDPTGCRKILFVLDFIEKEYNKHFEFIMICQTLQWNKTYHIKG